MIIVVAGLFAVMGYYAYKHYYVHVEVANCSNAEHITDDMLKDLPTLKKALEIAEKRGEVTLKITVEEFNKMRYLSGHCVEYGGKTYRAYLVTL